MSGQTYRTLINQLVGQIKDARYLEIGSWRGSTATAAVYNNDVRALCIDNWSQFGGPKEDFLLNIDRVRSTRTIVDYLEMDFRIVEYNDLGKYNIFLFDGPHEEQDQYDGIVITKQALETRFVLIVDDWNWKKVRLGTFRGILDSDYSVLSSVEVRTTQNNSFPKISGTNSDWHNGYFIAVIEKI